LLLQIDSLVVSHVKKTFIFRSRFFLANL
jgi:hypothetical protein